MLGRSGRKEGRKGENQRDRWKNPPDCRSLGLLLSLSLFLSFVRHDFREREDGEGKSMDARRDAYRTSTRRDTLLRY